MTRILFLTILTMVWSGLSAQEADTTDLSLLQNLKAETEASDLQKKLNENIGAASKKALNSRETPGIVSVITADDMQRIGARDMIDVLRMIPGFDFASDINFVTGLTLRGAWSLEGKILVLLDGMEINDLVYQNVAFFNRFPIDLIHRIEVMRGPGSAIYGGTAAYGVINIITKGEHGDEGMTATVSGGMLPDHLGRFNTQVGFVKKIGSQSRIDASYFRGQAIKSDQKYQDLYQVSEPVDLARFTETFTYTANVGLTLKSFQLRSIFEDYSSGDPFLTTQFRNFFISARNPFSINNKLTVTPYLYYSNQLPWRQAEAETNEMYFELKAQRTKAGLFASHDFSRRLNLIAGAEALYDKARSDADPTYFGGKDEVKFNLYSFYAQALLKHRLVNITTGFRIDKHNIFGAAFVPRMALTRRINNFHFKVLASGSYRAPGIDNINLNPLISPERSTVLELELGYQINADMLLSVNTYSIKTEDIIIYFYENLGGGEYLDGYENNSRFGSKGIEIVYTYKKAPFYFDANYSFYRARESTAERLAVPGRKDVFIGVPSQKTTLMAGADVTRHISLNFTFNYFSERFAYTTIDEQGNPTVSTLPSYGLLNANVSYKDFLTKGLLITFGGYDLLNERPVIPQAYNGDVAPLSGRSREIMLKASYTIPFTSKAK